MEKENSFIPCVNCYLVWVNMWGAIWFSFRLGLDVIFFLQISYFSDIAPLIFFCKLQTNIYQFINFLPLL